MAADGGRSGSVGTAMTKVRFLAMRIRVLGAEITLGMQFGYGNKSDRSGLDRLLMPVYVHETEYMYMYKYRDRYMEEFKAKAPLHCVQDQPDRSWYIILVYAKKTPSRWYVPTIIIINADATL